MIRTYMYGGRGEIVKGGEKAIVQLPRRVVLSQVGPFIEVTLTHPRIVQEQLKEEGKSPLIVSVKALIDTGASNSVITPGMAEQLGLIHTGYQKVSSVQDEQQRPVYFGAIVFPWGSGKEIPIVACPLKNFDCLIGRDILRHWHFTYNGPYGSIDICD